MSQDEIVKKVCIFNLIYVVKRFSDTGKIPISSCLVIILIANKLSKL